MNILLVLWYKSSHGIIFYSSNLTLIALTDRAYTPKSATTKPITHTKTKEPIRVPKMPFTRNCKIVGKEFEQK